MMSNELVRKQSLTAADLEQVMFDREQTRPEWINVVGITGHVTTEPSSMFRMGSAVHVEVMLWTYGQVRESSHPGWLVFKTADMALPHAGASALFGVSCKLSVVANVLRITDDIETLFSIRFSSDANITLKSYKRTALHELQRLKRQRPYMQYPDGPPRRMTIVVASHELNSSRDTVEMLYDNLFGDPAPPDNIFRLSDIVWFRHSAAAAAATLLVRMYYMGLDDTGVEYYNVLDVRDRWTGLLRIGAGSTMVLNIGDSAVATVRAAEGPILPTMLELRARHPKLYIRSAENAG